MDKDGLGGGVWGGGAIVHYPWHPELRGATENSPPFNSLFYFRSYFHFPPVNGEIN